jgi:hypothetical protein
VIVSPVATKLVGGSGTTATTPGLNAKTSALKKSAVVTVHCPVTDAAVIWSRRSIEMDAPAVPDVTSCVQPLPAVIVVPPWWSATAKIVAPSTVGVAELSDMPLAPVVADPWFVAVATTSNAPRPDTSSAAPDRKGAFALRVATTVAVPPVVTFASQMLSACVLVVS